LVRRSGGGGGDSSSRSSSVLIVGRGVRALEVMKRKSGVVVVMVVVVCRQKCVAASISYNPSSSSSLHAHQTIKTYKFWGLGNVRNYYLSLPSCTTISLIRSDGLTALDLYAPRLTTLVLTACHDLVGRWW